MSGQEYCTGDVEQDDRSGAEILVSLKRSVHAELINVDVLVTSKLRFFYRQSSTAMEIV